MHAQLAIARLSRVNGLGTTIRGIGQLQPTVRDRTRQQMVVGEVDRGVVTSS